MEYEPFYYSIDELFEQLREDPSWNEVTEERAAIASELKMTLG